MHDGVGWRRAPRAATGCAEQTGADGAVAAEIAADSGASAYGSELAGPSAWWPLWPAGPRCCGAPKRGQSCQVRGEELTSRPHSPLIDLGRELS